MDSTIVLYMLAVPNITTSKLDRRCFKFSPVFSPLFLFVLYLLCFSLLVVRSDAAFSDIGLGARPMGMGGGFVALADDANSVFWNPAGLSQIHQFELSSMYLSTNHLDLESRLLQTVLRHPMAGGIGIGFYRTGETGSFTEENLVVAAGQSLQPLINSNLSIGVSLWRMSKVYAGIDPSDLIFQQKTGSEQLRYDIGILWKPWRFMSLGGSTTNLNGTSAGSFRADLKNPPVSVLRTGLAIHPVNRLVFVAEAVQRLSYSNFAPHSFRFGTEWQPIQLLSGPVSGIIVRTGARLSNKQGNALFSGVGLRLGLNDLFSSQLDYAFSLPFTPDGITAGDTHLFSLSFAWLRSPGYPRQIARWKRELCMDSSRLDLRSVVMKAYQDWLDSGIRSDKTERKVRREKYAWRQLNNGVVSYRLERLEQAKKRLEEAIKYDIKLAEAYKLLALIGYKQKQKEIVQKYYDEALKLEPKLHFSEQIVQYLTTLAVRPKSTPERSLVSYQEYMRLGTLASAKSDYETAIWHWKIVWFWTPNEPVIQDLIVDGHSDWIESEKEDSQKRNYIERKSRAWDYIYTGYQFHLKEKYDLAQQNLKQSLELDPEANNFIDSVLPESAKQFLSSEKKLTQESRSSARIELVPTPTQTPGSEMSDGKTSDKYQESINLAMQASVENDYQTAIQQWKNALLCSPNHTALRQLIDKEYTDWLASQFMSVAEKQEVRIAHAAWKRVVRGYKRYLEGNYSAALEMLNEAVFLDPSLIEAYKWIGCIAAIQGNSIKASGAFMKALRAMPSFELTGEIPSQAYHFFNRVKDNK